MHAKSPYMVDQHSILEHYGWRILCIILSAYLFSLGYMMPKIVDILSSPIYILSVLAVYVFALCFLSIGVLGLKRLYNVFYYLTPIVITLFFAIYCIAFWNLNSYGTDSILFANEAIRLLLLGYNPYTIQMNISGIDYRWTTQLLNGELERTYSYPALSFLIYMPAKLAGIHNLNIVTAFAVFTAFIISYILTPKLLYPLPLLVFTIDPSLVGLSLNGVLDGLWLPFVIASAYTFYRCKCLHDRRMLVSGLLLGLAAAIKQTPWPIAFYLLVLLAAQKSFRELGWFLAGLLLGFLPPNMFFILQAPLAWLRGVLVPLLHPMVPEGYGLSILVATGHVILPRTFFTLLQILVALLIMFAIILKPKKTRPLPWLSPPLIFFFGWRSLHNYFVFFIPVAYIVLLLEVQGDKYNAKY
ncbi:MAG TPA: hypothetical protein EYH17_00325 [Pyrodictium sp.]|nr:hypothetical protein [Pyrodictium sp.]